MTELVKYLLAIISGCFIMIWWLFRRVEQEETKNARGQINELAEKARRDVENSSFDELSHEFAERFGDRKPSGRDPNQKE